ncbi:hypothetical protein C3F09_01905 [candidate division GN15 bacterium]|uniref:Zinc ribbon domain-containing protein n=1 Tax=candidate division GN15 bacterium TaxID=2072418 RepID=A0A855X3S5_9BACT|nr:MAG: hypothetical protein C3F09_01905 [candidate division GN15 bacterium]
MNIKKSLLPGLLIILCLLAVTTVRAEQGKPTYSDLTKLVRETQMMEKEGDDLMLIWWMPEEFWTMSLAQTNSLDDSLKATTVALFRPYTVIAVVAGKVGPLGGMTFVPEDSIRATTRLVDAKDNSYSPIMPESLEANVSTMLQVMAPIMGNMMGPIGKNMRFLVFPSMSKDSMPIASATQPGSFKVVMGQKEFKWRLPLSSLVQAKICPKCKEECSGAWRYCAWCGTELD